MSSDPQGLTTESDTTDSSEYMDVVDSDDTFGDEGGDSQPLENIAAAPEIPDSRLKLTPDIEHVSDIYDDPELEFSSLVLSSFEKYLPENLITLNRDEKAKLLSDILRKYISLDELSHNESLEIYREKIISNYEPRCSELFHLNPDYYFHPAYCEVIKDHSVKYYRRIMTEPSPGIVVFQMFRSDVVERLLHEVDHFKHWAKSNNVQIMKPSVISNHGVVLADFGMDFMLNKLVDLYLYPIFRVFFSDVCLGKFDTNHGYVVEYGMDAGYGESDFHVDDSEITVNVCLGELFEGGETYFRGIRCVKHEMFECSHTAGQVIIHRGRHRNGTRATTMGYRANMILWCRSSFYRERQSYDNGYFHWCGQCVKERKDNQSQILDAKRKEMFRIESSEPKVDETQHIA